MGDRQFFLNLFRPKNRRNTLAQHYCAAFNFGDRLKCLDDLVDYRPTLICVHHFTAAEHHRELNLVSLFQKFTRVVDLYFLVVLVDLRS